VGRFLFSCAPSKTTSLQLQLEKGTHRHKGIDIFQTSRANRREFASICYKTAPPNLASRPACIISQLAKMSNLEKYVSLSLLQTDFDSHFDVAPKQSSAHCAKSFRGYDNTQVHPPSEPTSLKSTVSFQPFLRRCSLERGVILELKVDAQKFSVFCVKSIPILHVAHTWKSLLQLNLKRLIF